MRQGVPENYFQIKERLEKQLAGLEEKRKAATGSRLQDIERKLARCKEELRKLDAPPPQKK